MRQSAVPGREGRTALDWRVLFGIFPLITAAVTAFSFAFSVVYNVTYYWVVTPTPTRVGPGALLSLLSISDYFASAIEWVPLVFVVSAIGAVLGIEMVKEKATKEAECSLQEASDRFERATRFVKRSNWINASLVVFGVVYFIASASTEFWSLIFIGAVFPLVVTTTTTWNPVWKAIIGSTLHLMMISVAISLSDVYADLTREEAPIPLRQTENVEQNEHEATLMRSFERGMLLRFPDNNEIRLINWQGLEVFRFVHKEVDDRRRVCVYFGWFCPKKPGEASTDEPSENAPPLVQQ